MKDDNLERIKIISILNEAILKLMNLDTSGSYIAAAMISTIAGSFDNCDEDELGKIIYDFTNKKISEYKNANLH